MVESLLDASCLPHLADIVVVIWMRVRNQQPWNPHLWLEESMRLGASPCCATYSHLPNVQILKSYKKQQRLFKFVTQSYSLHECLRNQILWGHFSILAKLSHKTLSYNSGTCRQSKGNVGCRLTPNRFKVRLLPRSCKILLPLELLGWNQSFVSMVKRWHFCWLITAGHCM